MFGNIVQGLVIAFAGAASAAFTVFIAICIGTFFGGVSVWVIGYVFPYVPDTIREISGFTLTDFQLGAVMGFVAGYIRNIVSSK